MPDAFLGEIRLFAGGTSGQPPSEWMFCTGQILPISSYSPLYALIGTTYGGNGVTTFGLPDLRGRVPIGQGGPYVIGACAGSETVSLTEINLPKHNHAFYATRAPADRTVLAAAQPAAAPVNDLFYQDSTGAAADMNAAMISRAGSGVGHDNMMPSLCLNYMIAVSGVFPSRN